METVQIASDAELADWLAMHHAREKGIWLVTRKKAAGDTYVGREAVLDQLIAWGWIDGRRKVLDELRTMQWIAPRQQKAWAESYKRRAARLEAEGRMEDPGWRAIAEAKAAGTWDASAPVDALIVPDDLATALGAAREIWDCFAPSKRRNILRWIAAAKRAETRAKRIAEIARLVEVGQTPPHM